MLIRDKSLLVSKQYNLWHKMINFDQQPNGSSLAFIFGAVYGWVCNLFLLDINTFSWQFLIKGISGIMFAVVSGLCVKVMNTFYEEKLKNKIFKPKRNGRRKDNQEAA